MLVRKITSIAGALLTLSVSQGFAQNWTQYQQIGSWTINQYDSSEVAGDAPSCSARRLNDHINAIRIERVAEGHLIGFNGMNRKYDGPSFEVEFWFDGNTTESWQNTAFFAKDAAYPDDDWLSLGHLIGEHPSFTEAFSGRHSISISITIPGGDRPVVVTHPLVNSTEVLASLEQCYLAALNTPPQTNPQLSQHSTSDCPDDGPRLAGSRICQGRAVNYLTTSNPESALMEGCEWTVNETALPGGDYLLYQAAKCGPHTATLELTGGAHSAVLSISKSAISGGTPSWNVAKVFSLNGMDPKDEIMMRAGQFMSDPSEAAKCMVRSPMADFGFPSDAYVVDYKPEYQNLLSEDQPHWVCGELGLNDQNMAFWRVFGGFAWFIEMGQDAWWEFDPASMTVLTAAELQGR